LETPDDVLSAYASHRRGVWVLLDSSVLAAWMTTIKSHDTWHRLLVPHRTTAARRELLQTLFRTVVAPDDQVKLLPVEELVEVLASGNARDLFVGGVVDREDNALVLYRGDLDPLVVPLSWFKANRGAPRPDPARFEVTDYGPTVRLGESEAAADAILYEFDPEARRRMRERERESDRSFGGALRRLRLARGLSRSDFPGLSDKTIGRLERGEVEKPHGETLEIIAKRLGVAPAEIESY
jgi:hypothetical protein